MRWLRWSDQKHHLGSVGTDVAELLLFGYFVAGVITARTALHYMVEEVDQDDTLDMMMTAFMAIICGLIWPVIIAASALIFWVRWTALKGRHDA